MTSTYVGVLARPSLDKPFIGPEYPLTRTEGVRANDKAVRVNAFVREPSQRLLDRVPGEPT